MAAWSGRKIESNNELVSLVAIQVGRRLPFSPSHSRVDAGAAPTQIEGNLSSPGSPTLTEVPILFARTA